MDVRSVPETGSEQLVDLTVLSEQRMGRLSELVEALTGCEPLGARRAVQTVPRAADPLAIVARAMVHVDRPRPEGFRVTGFLRDDLTRRPRRRSAHTLPRRVIGGLPHRQKVLLPA